MAILENAMTKYDVLKIVQLEEQLKMYKPIIGSLNVLPVLQENIKQMKKQLDKMENKSNVQDKNINDLYRSLDILQFKLSDTIKDIEADKKEIDEYLKLVDSVKGLGWKILCRIIPTLIVLSGMIFAGWEFLKGRF